ncbi:MAG: WecB/TagA/CpsF family glycosyltransferase [Planctomycetota bacterium]|nr:WecB/TagA/CpsF family glycosyltransferase [Planctomycetota bacterium]
MNASVPLSPTAIPSAAAPPKVRILGVGISATTYEEVSHLLLAWGKSGRAAYVCVCNVHTVMLAQDDPVYAEAINGAAIATPDGMPLVWALRRRGYPQQQRVYGPDLLLAFAATAAQTGSGANFFYGGQAGTAEKLASLLQARFPGFAVAGAECPPFRPLTPAEDAAAVARINASGAQVLWLGLGAPKQELWMAAHRQEVKPVMVGVGAAFDFLTGRVKQAPPWLRNLGLEWLFRLAVEPRRLWRRYLWHNPRFLWHWWRESAAESKADKNSAGKP